MNDETAEAVREAAPDLELLAEHDRPAGQAARAWLEAADAAGGGEPA